MAARPARRARCDERGAAMVEVAMVALLLVTLLAGALDYGMAWRTGLAVNEASRTGARVGSAQGVDVHSDYNILTGLRSALASSGQLGRLERVVIFRSDGPDGRVPADCTTTLGSTAEPCNVLTGDQVRALPTVEIAATSDASGCIDASMVKGWCPSSRVDAQATWTYPGLTDTSFEATVVVSERSSDATCSSAGVPSACC